MPRAHVAGVLPGWLPLVRRSFRRLLMPTHQPDWPEGPWLSPHWSVFGHLHEFSDEHCHVGTSFLLEGLPH